MTRGVCDEAGVRRGARSASGAGQVGKNRAGELLVGDAQALERLCRYVTRPPIVLESEYR
jgi:hypothetical protein